MTLKLGGFDDFTKTTLKTVCQLKKHKGETISDILEHDEDYILWMYDSNIIEPDKELTDRIYKIKADIDENNKSLKHEGDRYGREFLSIFDKEV